MVDIHYHLLFGVDDGPQTIEASLELAEASIAEGVTHIVCTPHASDDFIFRPDVNQERLALLNERLRSRITLGLGCDFRLSYDNIEDALRNRTKYTINGQQYLLVEFPDYAISQFSAEALHEFMVNGIVPIITHPERNPHLVADADRMAAWLEDGCLVQVTAASLAGRLGKQAQATCDDLIKKNWVHFVASDAHSIKSRPPEMASAYKHLNRHFGQATADRLCWQNPRAAFFGEVLPANPAPIGLEEDSMPAQGFFSRIFRRGY